MSAYRVIRTEFKNLDSLVKALDEIGYSLIDLVTGGKANNLDLKDWHSQIRPEKCAVRINRNHISSASNDVGFAWNGQAYEVVVSDYDQRNYWTAEFLGKLKQVYAFHELSRQAKAKGYTVQKSQTENGVIRMKLIRR